MPRFRVCAVCQRVFAARRSDALYCAPKCRQKAFRLRLTPPKDPQ